MQAINSTLAERLIEVFSELPDDKKSTVLDFAMFVRQKEFPLDLHVPNQLTADTLFKSSQNQEIERYDTTDELYASWEE